MTVKLEDIESLDGEKVTLPKAKKQEPKSEEQPTPQQTAPAIRTSKNTFDLRGSRVADAERVLDEAIALANGPIWIIHGHGTGKLRQGVHSFLKQHPRVSRYEAAEQAEGGTGVTIAYVE